MDRSLGKSCSEETQLLIIVFDQIGYLVRSKSEYCFCGNLTHSFQAQIYKLKLRIFNIHIREVGLYLSLKKLYNNLHEELNYMNPILDIVNSFN